MLLGRSGLGPHLTPEYEFSWGIIFLPPKFPPSRKQMTFRQQSTLSRAVFISNVCEKLITESL